MLKVVQVKIEDIYIPAARRGERDQDMVDAVIERILEDQHEKPIKVRKGKGRFVLIAGINRLEAARAVGEQTIDALIVQAQKF